MGTNYDITMKQFNGTDYDVLYPKTVDSQVGISNSVLQSYYGNNLLSVLNYNRNAQYKLIFSDSQAGTGTWTPTYDCNILVVVIGGGASGKAAISTASVSGTGGDAGHVNFGLYSATTTQTYNYVVGAGGSGVTASVGPSGSATTVNGNNGNTSSFKLSTDSYSIEAFGGGASISGNSYSYATQTLYKDLYNPFVFRDNNNYPISFLVKGFSGVSGFGSAPYFKLVNDKYVGESIYVNAGSTASPSTWQASPPTDVGAGSGGVSIQGIPGVGYSTYYAITSNGADGGVFVFDIGGTIS